MEASGFGADGNTLSGNGRTNAWDSQNRLVSCTLSGSTSTYKYGADGLRRQKTTNGASTDSAYDATMMVREGHASGGSLTPATVTATYLIGARGPEYRRDDTQSELDSQGRTVTKARWYVYDGLGSVVGEVDPLGTLTSSPKYDVYGAVRANAGTASSKQGFVGSLGHVSDDTGLIYMKARYYDPSLGRFTSEDPKGDGNNWFIYCSDNPINYVDPDGKILLDPHMLQQFVDWLIKEAGNNPKILAQILVQVTQKVRSGLRAIGIGSVALAKGEAQDAAGNEIGGKTQELTGAVETESGATEFANSLMLKQEAQWVQLQFDFGEEISLFD